MLFTAQNVWADSGAWYFKEKAGFGWTVCGNAEIEFSIPVFIWDSSSNDAVKWGHIYVTPGGENETELLYYAYDEDDDSRNMSEPVTFQAMVDGDFRVTNTTSGSVGFNRNDGKQSWVLTVDADDNDHHTAKIRWKVPYNWRGKTLSFRVHFCYFDKFSSNNEVQHQLESYECPAGSDISITLNDPMLAFESSSAGHIMIPWYAQAKSLTNAKLHAVDAVTGHVTMMKVTTSALTGYVRIPMDRPYSSVQLSGQVKTFEGEDVPGELSSNSISVPMFHTPTNFSATMQPDGKVVLKWKVNLPNQHDIMDFDMFEIQRNMTGSTNPDDAAWQTIQQEPYEENKENYEVVDADMISRYQGHPVTYRVRRSGTSFWGWVPAAKYAQVQIPANVNLFGINHATAQRGSSWDPTHVVNFAFNFSGPEVDENGTFIIRTATDWEKFAQRVNAGETTLNAIMAGDIDLGNSQVMVGTMGSPYMGAFDGQGYTLTVHYKNNDVWTAPFLHVKGAKIKGLNVDGDITTSLKHVGGLIGSSTDATSISDCSVSAVITSSFAPGTDGACMGGFVSRVNSSSTVVGLVIKNCRFAGQLLGENCHSNGGFVGYAASKVKFEKCVFAPTKITTLYDGCKTYCRGVEPELIDCYYTICYDGSKTTVVEGRECRVIRTVDDWLAFRDAVATAKGNSDVNAVLGNDLSVNYSIGSSDAPFRGYFNGNGYTLNVNINSSGYYYAAPFPFVKEATIKNVHVTGKVEGSLHASGLVGAPNTVYINNVRVSVTITASNGGGNGPHAGGFVGHASSSFVSIRNSLFDGIIISRSWNDSWAGAFIGWSGGPAGTWRFENNYENGKYVNFRNVGMCVRDGSWWGGSNTSYSTYNWSEMASNENRNAEGNSALVKKLGTDNWMLDGGLVVPQMPVSSMGQGTTALPLTDDELLAKLGDKWQVKGNTIVPVAERTEGSIYGSTVWDPRAQLKLRVNMHGENGVDSKIIDLSNNEDAINKHQFSYELTRKCVEYSFDLMIVRGKSTLPIVGEKGDTAIYAVTKIDEGQLANYRFENGNEIIHLKSTTKQSSVELTWETVGGDCDFYRVLRRLHSDTADAEWTDTIATDLNQLFFEDKTVLVQKTYDYRVESVFQCEGVHIYYKTCTGACETTGMIDGYIRMADGTAMSDVTVMCRPIYGIPGANAYYEATTDNTGYYVFRGLPFHITNGYSDGSYVVWVVGTGDGGSYTGPGGSDASYVTFGQNSNWTTDFNFFMDTYYVLSGNVYYQDTTIPVPGVSFKLDGNEMHDANQKVIQTDTQGAFSLSIPRGIHSIQAVKEGHVFAEDGYLINPWARTESESHRFNFIGNVSNVFLWDTTTVMLRGRVVGGDVQGSKPLGQGLSENNLGDSIKIVMQLDGDNASYLVFKMDDGGITSESYDVSFGPADENTSHVDVKRHTLTIFPDEKTGEYQLKLHPAKYKVIEVSGMGYATLFQQGKVGETLDLALNVQGDTCEYSRIYHSVPTVDVKQFNPGSEPYFGVKKLTATDNVGNKSVVNTWYWKKTSETDSIGVYSFGYPVFMGGSPYGWTLQACEKYYKNNDQTTVPDIVNLSGGKVSIMNALTTDSKTAEWECELDENGSASYIFTPNNPNVSLVNDRALKNVNITLEYDENFYEVKPFNGQILQGYVMAIQPMVEGRKTIVSGTPKLFDILRDPPGGGSSAYIEEGSKLSYGYSFDLDASLGFSLKTSKISGADSYKGIVAGGTEAGLLSSVKKEDKLDFSFKTAFGMSWTYSYNIDVTERIQTSTSKKWVGSKADIFIGTTENIVIQDAMAVRVIPNDMYQLVKLHEGGTFTMTDSLGNTAKIKVPVGTMKVLAQGTDNNGKPIYLVRDEVMQVYPAVSSTFMHTQHYIENELLTELMKTRNSLLLPSSTDSHYAQALANKQGYPAYVSDVDAQNDNFALPGYYSVYYPEGKAEQFSDSIHALNQEMYAWISMLAKNEEEKLQVMPRNLVKRYDFDGGTSIQYSETFSTSQNGSRYLRYPILSDFGNLFDFGGLKFLTKALETALTKKSGGIENGVDRVEDENGRITCEVITGGVSFSTSVKPIVTASFNDKFTTSETHSKKTGFTLSASSKSSLTVDVYRTETQYTYNPTENAFYELTEEMLNNVRNGKLNSTSLSWADYNTKVYSNLVFRTIGGVTCEPYEKERTTKWYQPGTVLDVATIPADKPRIWIDDPEVSNVPFDEPARFTLHMANESDYPERASLIFNYYLLASSNPDGAKVLVDGMPISSGGVNIVLYPCRDKNNEVVVFDKQIEVWPGKEFDYNDLTLCLYDPDDPVRVFSVKFSAHFVPTAGKVNISSPGNNWVMNTDSPYDGDRHAWYMPVSIDGFDTNYRGFDHIELQYKLSTQGDKDWVNVCSYYKDKELMAKASGKTDTIPPNGVIIARFYGEGDPVEQRYDIRAVNYCRHAGGFLTGSSEILKGIKDTRLPVAFGTPQPTDGILNIGDDIIIKFSEPIAGNYLRKINNFEVLGTMTNNDVSTSTSLSFTGESYAFTQGSRNLAGKSFTVDVMLNPATDSKQMTVFSHGGEENGLSFGLTADRKLSATINGNTVESDKAVEFSNALREVAYVLDQSGDSMTVRFFDGGKPIGSRELSGKYNDHASELIVGVSTDGKNTYKGDMLEFRLWNRALDGAALESYGRKRLTGYESGLLDYYPMNEGDGSWAYDKAPGSMDLFLASTSWKRPAGISVALKGEKGLRLKKDKFTRSKDHDYTLMFWFRTLDSLATIFSNGEARRGFENQINIGLKDHSLYVRSSGFEKDTRITPCDGYWHHFAMTVSRSQNVANIYLDKILIESFAADSLSGINSDDDIALGATYVDKNTPVNVMHGNIDEVGMFSSVLPLNLIKEFSNHTPFATMSAMMAYLDFGRSEKNEQNTQRLEPSGVSLKRYVDSQGNQLSRQDVLVADDEVRAFADRDIFAPMVSRAQMDNLNYSFVANDNELYINIIEPDYMVEKSSVHVTVKEVSDLQGNLMASPLTMDAYVYRNPLRWNVKHIDKEVRYGEGLTFEATVKNLSGVTQNYTLADLPVWISASQTNGLVGALDEETITFTISPYINIGTYNEQITLVGNNKMSEPLPVTLRIRGSEPGWEVSDGLKQGNQTMMMVARVKIDGVVASSKDDILAVFDEHQQTLGVAHIELNENANANEALAYLTIYGYTNPDNTKPTLNFRFYKAGTGSVYSVAPADSTIYTFSADAFIGSATDPVILKDDPAKRVGRLSLKKGWNWVTIPVTPQNQTVGQFLNGLSEWEAGDKIISINGTTRQEYTCRENQKAPRGYLWDKEDEPITILPTQMYSIYSVSDKVVCLEGNSAYQPITVHKDWNRIGYLTTINLPVSQALSDYMEQAQEGDVVKSQDGFAVASRTANGLVWKGTLQYMEAGKGYMLKRQADSEATFYYPLYFLDNRYSGSSTRVSPRHVSSLATMNIVATVEGIETGPGDRLVVYSGAERIAEAIADDEQNYYLNIGSDADRGEPLSFAIERDGEAIAMTGSRINFVANKVMGTPEQPTAISFTALARLPHDGKWYTLSGLQLPEQPTHRGLYIHNGKVKIMK